MKNSSQKSLDIMEESPQNTSSGLEETPQTLLDKSGDSVDTPAASEKVNSFLCVSVH